MANPANINAVRENLVAGPPSVMETLIAEHNKLIDSLRGITAKLDADATVTDTNYAALWSSNGSASPAKITLI